MDVCGMEASKPSAHGNLRAAAMWACVLGQVLATALWASLSSAAITAVRDADADVGNILGSTLTLAFSAYAVTTGIMLACVAVAAAAMAMRWRAHAGAPNPYASWATSPGLPGRSSDWPSDALPSPSPSASASCTKPAACTAVNVLYVGLMLWACAAIAGYACWMGDTSAVVEGAEVSLLRGATGAARAAGAAASQLGAAARTLASADDGLASVGAAVDVGEGAACAAECLDLRSWRFRFAHAPACVCDRATLQGLCDTGIALYDSLVAALTVLLLVYGTGSMGLIYISALLARADGRSEIEVVMEEGDRVSPHSPGSAACRSQALSYGSGGRELAAGGGGGGGGGLWWGSVFSASRQSAWLTAAPVQSMWSPQAGGVAGGCERVAPEAAAEGGSSWRRNARRLIAGRFSGGGGCEQQGGVLAPVSARQGRSGSCFDPHGGGLDGAAAHAAHDVYKRWL